ncbi:MAG: TonB-dependent receptor [Flavobacteriaceae bacterium]|nr:TonB-dependent receptor [Flavobacteriaceae bacterium]MDZ4148452.1 TonB-dependent receptor [Flavobacteriaceae bacterium]
MNKKFLLYIFLSLSTFVFSQNLNSIKGIVIDATTTNPLSNVLVSIENTNISVVTDANGAFVLQNIPIGKQVLLINYDRYISQSIPLEITASSQTDLQSISLVYNVSQDVANNLISLTEDDLNEDNSGSENTAGLLQSSRDAFLQAAAFNFGQARFRVRGYDSENGTVLINGLPVNKLLDGRPQWNNWGGLNDVTRNQELANMLTPSDFNFGGVLGTTNINTRASQLRKGARFTGSATNRNYSGRLMATYNSGLMTNGWAYSVSIGRRWAEEGHFDGTFYDANSFFLGIEKKFNEKHSLNFSAIYTPNRRGRNSPNTQEVKDLTDYKYNSYWGYQNGEKRNSRVREVEEPIFMLNHYWKISDKTKLNTNVSYQFGKIGNSRLEFSNANTSDPVNFRKLPSFFLNINNNSIDGTVNPDFENAERNRIRFLENKQIDWVALYQQNQSTGNGESVHVLFEDRIDDQLFTANTILNTQLSDNIKLNAGVTYKHLNSDNFAHMLDLLGGQFFRDIDDFSIGDARQSDLNNPDRTVGVGDRFAYNYEIESNAIESFAQLQFSTGKFDYFLATKLDYTDYQRNGLYRNGRNPENSFGKSEKLDFTTYGVKGGLTYKITGRHALSLNAGYLTKPPSIRNSFSNTRVNNDVVNGLDEEKVFSFDGNYIVRTPVVKARLSGYYTQFRDATEISFFFADFGGTGNDFFSEVVTGIDKKNFGGEFGIEVQATPTIEINAAAAVGQYTFSDNANVVLNTEDAIIGTRDLGNAFIKDFKVSGTPQTALSLGFEYRNPKFWWVGANANFIADNYVDIATVPRTEQFFVNPDDPDGFPFPEATTEAGRKLLKQERLDDFYLVNIVAGKSWRIKGYFVGLTASVDNLFDEKFKTGGFEQSRAANFRELNADNLNGTPSFGPRYFYGFARTFFINLYVSF